MTGLANAQAGGIPLVVLAGRTPLGLQGRGAVQDVDQQGLAKVVAKWTRAPATAADVAPALWEALVTARAGRPGAAYLELPTDVLTAEAPPVVPSSEGKPAGFRLAVGAVAAADPGAVDAAVDILARAERPVCVAGGGAFWAGAGAALARFAEATRIPVTTTSHARGLLPDGHSGCLGSLLHGGVGVALADAVLVVGSRFNGNLLFGRAPLFNDCKIVQVDCDPTAFALNREPELALLGDAAVVLGQLAEAWRAEPKKAWLDESRSYAQASMVHWVGETEADARGVHPGWLAREVCAFAAEQGAGSTVVIDGGDILGWGLAFVRAEEPGSFLFTSDSLGTLGVGVPYAVAAPLARAGGPTIALIGDGAFGFSAMELETAARIGTAPVVVVSNNGSWGDVRYEETEWFGATAASDLTKARYDRLGEALGGRGERVERPEQLRPALERAVAAGEPTVIDVLTDPDRPNEVLRNMGSLNLQ